jgi:hypothetical protein
MLLKQPELQAVEARVAIRVDGVDLSEQGVAHEAAISLP